MRSAMERGKWVFFQNCHLAPSFMPSLERLVENIDPDKVGGGLDFKVDFKCFVDALLRHSFY